MGFFIIIFAIMKSKSTKFDDYEILIRKRGESDFASYCPQINLMIKGNSHQEVHLKMKEKIEEHIFKILSNEK